VRHARRTCVFTECGLMPSWRAISFVVSPRATSQRISIWRSVSAKCARDRSSRTRRAIDQPATVPIARNDA
jgi:hypothetical protein